MQEIIQSIKKSGFYSEKAIFSKEELKTLEKNLNYQFPDDYKILVSTIEPEIVNFYFIKPYRSKLNENYIIFAEWTNDKFAFYTKDNSIITIMDEDDSGMKWGNFTEWFNYVWKMSQRPTNPE